MQAVALAASTRILRLGGVRCVASSVSRWWDSGKDIQQASSARTCVCQQWYRGMAGHSHWQNIKHTKQANDAKRAIITNRCIRSIRLAIKEGGGNNPVSNAMLNQAIKQARNCEIPVAKIEKALKGNDKPLERFSYELKGPENCFFIVDTLTENKKRTQSDLRSIAKKIPLMTVLSGGTLGHIFSHKGMVLVENVDGISVESALDHAIEVGAEEVQEEEHEDGKKVLKFITGPFELHAVTKQLEEMKYNVLSSELFYLPQVKQKVSEDSMILINTFYELLETVPEVVEIHNNIE